MPYPVTDVEPLALIQNGRDLLKVSTVYDTYFTAQVLMENGKLPPRTTVRSYLKDDLVTMRTPTRATTSKYEQLMGWEK